MTNERQEMFERYHQEASIAAKERSKVSIRREELRKKAFRKQVERALVKDLQRVFHHPNNPYAGNAASRQRYRDLGYYPDSLVSLIFGTHEEFQRAAGLKDERGTQSYRLNMARAASELPVQEYVDEHVKQDWGWDTEIDSSRYKVIAAISDTHAEKMDPMVLRIWLDCLEMIQPDGVLANGDILDNTALSQHPKYPSERALSFQGEIDFTRDQFWQPTIAAAPHAWRKWLLGNHEHTAIRTLAKTAPQILSLDCMNWNDIFEADRLGIEMCMGGNAMATTKRGERQLLLDHHEDMYDAFRWTHGKFTGRNAADKELDRAGMSGASGHLHRYELFTKKGKSWTIMPMGAGYSVGRCYANDPWEWTMGFIIVTIDTLTGRSFVQPVIVYEDGCSFNGRIWTPTKDETEIREHQWNG